MKKSIIKKLFIKLSKIMGYEIIDQNNFTSPTLGRDLNKETVLFCAAGGRSALAAKTLKEMGFNNVSHVEGGFGLMVQKGFKIKT